MWGRRFRLPVPLASRSEACLLLAPLLTTVVASKLFGIALFCSGQSSTLTGAMAGQIVMEGDAQRMGQFRTAWWLRLGGWVTTVIVVGLNGWLAWITLQPYRGAAARPATLRLEQTSADLVQAPEYRRILVPLDHSGLDRLALSHAAGIAARTRARVYLLHIEEGVTSQIYGPEASTAVSD